MNRFEKIALSVTAGMLLACSLLMFGMLALASEGTQMIGQLDKLVFFSFALVAMLLAIGLGMKACGRIPTPDDIRAATDRAIAAGQPDKRAYL